MHPRRSQRQEHRNAQISHYACVYIYIYIILAIHIMYMYIYIYMYKLYIYIYIYYNIYIVYIIFYSICKLSRSITYRSYCKMIALSLISLCFQFHPKSPWGWTSSAHPWRPSSARTSERDPARTWPQRKSSGCLCQKPWGLKSIEIPCYLCFLICLSCWNFNPHSSMSWQWVNSSRALALLFLWWAIHLQ